VHRDLKPDNVLVSVDRGTYKLCDFGLARSVEGEQTLGLVATTRYMSPTLASGGAFEPADDLWAFAGLLLELAVGHCPYPNLQHPLAISAEITRGRTIATEMLPQVDRRTPQAIRDLAARCCSERPQDRGSFAEAWAVCDRTLRSCFGFESDAAAEWTCRPGFCFREQPLIRERDDERWRAVVHCLAETTGRSAVLQPRESQIERLRMVRNDALSQAFLWAQSVLRQRCCAPAVFGPKWQDEDDPKQLARLPDREWTMRQLEAVCQRASPMHNEAESHKLLLVFHCTSRGAATKICETGFAALASIDPGYFGQGMYFTPDADYAWNVYRLPVNQNKVEKEQLSADGTQETLTSEELKDLEPVLLACWLVIGNAFPIHKQEGPHDPSGFLQKPQKSGWAVVSRCRVL